MASSSRLPLVGLTGDEWSHSEKKYVKQKHARSARVALCRGSHRSGCTLVLSPLAWLSRGLSSSRVSVMRQSGSSPISRCWSTVQSLKRPAAVLPEPPAPEPAVDGATLELSQLLGSPAIPTNLLGDADESMPVVEFAGAKATNAKRIVYVVDASGSLVSWMQIVLNELFRSLEQLDDRQQFAIIFFQEDRAIEVPPLRRLQKATSQARRRAIDWISEGDNVVPGYGSNPVTALEAAFDLHPEVIFLLSDSITGSGAYEVDQASLLAALESMNPLRDAASGRRDVLIQCIQFLGEQEDRLGTMRRIAELHGGEGGYKVYDRKAMGLED